MFDSNVPKFITSVADAIYFFGKLESGEIQFISPSCSELLDNAPAEFYERGFDLIYTLIASEDLPSFLRYHIQMKALARKLPAGQSQVIVDERQMRRQQNSTSKNLSFHLVEVFYLRADEISVVGLWKNIQEEKYDRRRDRLNSLLFGHQKSWCLARLGQQVVKSTTGNNGGLQELAQTTESEIRISPREKEVLDYIANGLSSKEIAAQLFISESTVCTHRKRLLEKFNSKNSAELIKHASKRFWFE